MSDPSNVREGQPVAPMAFPEGLLAGGDRVQQPGTLIGTRHQYSNMPKQENIDDAFPVLLQASDRFAVVNYSVKNDKAYRLLPVDYHRKRALIIAYSGAGIWIGEEPAVDIAATIVSGGGTNPPNVYPVLLATAAGGFQTEYTSKQSLYACSQTGGTPAFVSVLVERFNSGTPPN